jgi:23S rRNA (uracil-5-)-methyltransferase RumA
VKKHTGYGRYLVIREGKFTNQRMVMFVTAAGELPAPEKLVAALGDLATTVYHGVNPTITDLSIADELTLLSGAPLLEEKIDGKTFSIHPNSFFQTNSAMAEALVHKVREFIGENKPEVLLDLYCGVGLFGICLAGDAKRVVGVEIDPKAIEMARANATRNGLTNAEYFAAKTESLIWENENPDTVIIDPPRAGLHPDVVKTLLSRKPKRLIYVSCNYESFCREWAELSKEYKIERLEALDLFPHSPHVETVALLTLK